MYYDDRYKRVRESTEERRNGGMYSKKQREFALRGPQKIIESLSV
jgi:hypothetical protein